LIPEGRLVGQPVVLRGFQRRLILRIYDNPHGTRTAIFSVGRKNAKTALAAFMVLLHLCGPEALRSSQIVSTAQSLKQAAVLFDLTVKVIRLNADLDRYVTIIENRSTLICREIGSTYRSLSAEAKTAYGLSPVFIIHDELGQVQGARSALYEAAETGSSAHAAPLTLIISTQAPADTDLLSILIDDALKGTDDHTIIEMHTADELLDPFSLEAIKQANPAFGDFQNAAEVMKSAESARRMPSREASYRNVILNQRVQASSPFVTKSVWTACNGPVASLKGHRVWGGLDLSETGDLTALVLIACIEGIWHIHPIFWLPEDGIEERARADRQPYDLYAEEGFLELTPGPSIEFSFVAHRLRGVFDEFDVQQIGYDRFRMKYLRAWLVQEGFDEIELEQFVEFGQGFVSMAPALNEVESLLLQRKYRHGGHPVMTMCAHNAVVTRDPAGNRKLDKPKSRGRIDGMQALAIAAGVAVIAEPVTRSIYELEGVWPTELKEKAAKQHRLAEFLAYVRNTNGGATIANFIEDWEPIGSMVWDELQTGGLARVGQTGRLELTEAGARLLP
jgi:phage terminase large subunit-like protein